MNKRLLSLSLGLLLACSLHASATTRVLAGGLSFREYLAIHCEPGSPPPSFVHRPPPGMPAAPAYPDTLNTAEQAEMDQWFFDHVDAALTLTNAIAKRDAFKAYYTSAAYRNWRSSDAVARVVQWRWFYADTMAANSSVVTPTQTTDGTTGVVDPPGAIPARCVE